MLSPSPSFSTGGGGSLPGSKSVRVLSAAPRTVAKCFVSRRGGGAGASDGESGVSWMEDVEEKGGGVFLSPATDRCGVSSCRRRGVAGWVPISLHREGKGKKFGGLSCCVLSLVAARVSPVVCLLQSCLLRELLLSTAPEVWSCRVRGLIRPLPV